MASTERAPIALTIDTYETIADEHTRLTVHAYVRVSPTSPEVCIALLTPALKLTLSVNAAVELADELERCAIEALTS
jgi:hypothetical protein